MKLKISQLDNCYVNEFELLGSDEVAITKSLSFVLARSPKAIQRLLLFLGYRIRITKERFQNIDIEYEKFRDEGRTDIEVLCPRDFHLIVEAKIRKNRLIQQRSQYIKSFVKDVPLKIMCFVTSERTITSEKSPGVNVHYITLHGETFS